MLDATFFELIPWKSLSEWERGQRMPDYKGDIAQLWHLKACNKTYYDSSEEDTPLERCEVANIIVYNDYRNNNTVLFYYRTVNATLTRQEDVQMRELMKNHCEDIALFSPAHRVTLIPHGTFFDPSSTLK
jgi:hypothetical protein